MKRIGFSSAALDPLNRHGVFPGKRAYGRSRDGGKSSGHTRNARSHHFNHSRGEPSAIPYSRREKEDFGRVVSFMLMAEAAKAEGLDKDQQSRLVWNTLRRNTWRESTFADNLQKLLKLPNRNLKLTTKNTFPNSNRLKKFRPATSW